MHTPNESEPQTTVKAEALGAPVSAESPAVSDLRPGRPRLRALAWLGGASLLLALLALATIDFYRLRPIDLGRPLAAGDPAEVERLEARLGELRPRGPYVIVDSADNRLRLYRGDEQLLDTRCSTGTGTVLRDPASGRVWIFDTPTGRWQVRRKVRNPVWVKPDWAFIEEGESPPADPSERYDDVSLGDHGLYLGDGYIIHGTLFESLLGEPATHGCVRLGKKDLERLYDEVPIGASVFLY